MFLVECFAVNEENTPVHLIAACNLIRYQIPLKMMALHQRSNQV
ncbi:hypothetical protein A1OE_683 [Candidatus Endolissoclinum faulkneri L2]|uniref:Uncharacterized protein n=1 Tax=Candidatus Endolissoclinum faulkneri L2 TaxID=1193729 RepID=K7ZCS6_9PROT|nr:hypothetical protein A1OE_683 [Candidatus Endolissoclinum faulkneri L2]